VPTNPEQPLSAAEAAAILNDPNATPEQLAAVANRVPRQSAAGSQPQTGLIANTPPTKVRAPRKRLVWLIAGGTTALVAVLVVVLLLATPLLAWLGFGKSTTSPNWKDAPNASYLNGANLSWTLDLSKVFPGKTASFSFGPNGDDAWHWSRYAPLPVGDKWIAPYTIEGRDKDGSDYLSGLLALDPVTGNVLWDASNYQLSECATAAINGALPCLSARTTDNTRLVMVDLSNGSVRDLGLVGNAYGLEVAGDNVLAAVQLAETFKVTSYGADGAVRWNTELSYSEDDGSLADLSAPLTVEGEFVKVQQMGANTVLRLSDGAVALRGSGWGELLPKGVFAADSDFTPTVAAAAGLDYRKTSGNPQLMTTNGKQYLFVYPLGDQSPIQWCPDLDLAKCQQIPNTDQLYASSMTEVDGKPRYFVASSDGNPGSYDLVSGHVEADLTQITAPTTEGSDRGNYYSLLQSGQVGVTYDQDSGQVWMFSTVTGAQIARATLSGWLPLQEMPANRLVLGYSPDGYSPATKIAMYSPSAVAGSGLGDSAQKTSTALPADVPSCPSGSVQLAFATFSDGWVLVCGINATTPTQWYSKDADGRLDSGSVTYDPANYRYTAQFGDGTLGWLNHTPGVYGRTGSGSSVTVQRSVGVIWFVVVDSGQTASAQTTGPYGIPIPQNTSADQVRYLAALLTSSAKARADLQPAVISVRGCERGQHGDYSADVSTISSVTDNRRQLISALNTAPVDQVPDGVALVSELRTGLQYSLQADEAYLAWAQATNTNGCGSSSEANGTELSKKAGSAKDIFVKHWNTKIAGSFGVAQVSREKL
jgi:hypothetical protein